MNLDSAIFYTKDVKKITKFYQKVMGYKLEYKRGNEFVSFIFKNNARLGIRYEKGTREIAGHQTTFIAVKDIEREFKKAKDKKLSIYRELENHPWGKAFAILDPDNNKIEFISR
ncbi:MAG: glyoxalase superfamily protein [Candidatus Berkelbacteria bacterium]|nr:glyoxalase superfamily protein [Candidatus Berkelbacteria bacterium]